MIIGLIGESCTGKTTLLNELKKEVSIIEYSGKEYLKLDKNPQNAKMKFVELLNEVNDEIIVYVITEKDHLELLPASAMKILVTADLEVIKERFKKRMHNNLPKPVELMLERKHGMFDDVDCDLHISSTDLDENLNKVLKHIQNK